MRKDSCTGAVTHAASIVGGSAGSPVAIVNQRFVELHLDGGNALGRSVRAPSASMTIPSDSWLSVVGVVPNIRQTSLDERDQNLNRTQHG